MAPKDHQASTPTPQLSVGASAAPKNTGGNLQIKLTASIVTKSDISRCLREIISIDDYFHQAAVRGSKDQPLPALSKSLDSLASENGLNLLRGDDRSSLRGFLTRLKSSAPVVHMSFPSEASPTFLAQILEWFRREAHPYTVLRVGLQPELAAGCIVRTTNKSFDFSFRKRFEQSKQKLIAALEKASQEVASEALNAAEVAPPAPADSAVESSSQPAASTQESSQDSAPPTNPAEGAL